MNHRTTVDRIIEIYKSAVLTAIAILLGMYLSRSGPVTVGELRAKLASPDQIPVVFIRGGSVEVDNTVSVEVENVVEVAGTVDVAE